MVNPDAPCSSMLSCVTSWITSVTRELRRPGTFSLNVNPSTLTSAPLTWLPRWIISHRNPAPRHHSANATGSAAAWVKTYGGPEGTGLVQLYLDRNVLGNIYGLKTAIEYGLY